MFWGKLGLLSYGAVACIIKNAFGVCLEGPVSEYGKEHSRGVLLVQRSPAYAVSLL